MQSSVPELTDTRKRAGVDLSTLRRRREEARHVRQHGAAGAADGRARRALRADLPQQLGHARQRRRPPARSNARTSIKPCYGLIQDLKQRGLLDETLVIWGGEFGRTIYSQGGLSKENYGRDHHPRCFTMWMAGGGFKAGHGLRRDRRFLLQHREGPGPHPRLPRHRAAPARLRPRAVHLQVSRPRSKLTGVEEARVIKDLIA